MMPDAFAARQSIGEASQAETRRKAAVALEEELEEANVTDLRTGLLPTIERIQENPAIRVVIRKHGKRRAVLMSAATYDALMQVANLFVQANDRLSPEEKMEAAYQRLESMSLAKRSSPAGPGVALGVDLSASEGKEVKVLLENMQQMLRELDTKLGLGANY